MKNLLITVSTLSIFFCNYTNAQSPSVSQYIHGLSNPSTMGRTTGTSGTGANIDVIYHKVFWRINPDSTVKYIKGYVQTNFKTTSANVTTITLDMNDSLIADSIKFRGSLLQAGNISRAGNIISINLGVTLSTNFIDSFTIFYQGVPPAVAGAAQGYQLINIAGAGNLINTLSESYEDRDWWPCKADMQDKIDSMDIIVSVPWASPTAADTFWVAANGKMTDSVIVGGSRIFTFKNRYPMASYLVAVSVAKYKKFYRSVDINGTIVPVVYNILLGKSDYNVITTAMDVQNTVLSKFSEKMGDYPFKQEKHGFYDGLAGAGGMEHQTFSAIDPARLTDQPTLAHELTHQWFGDNVTFANWNDIWLAEGFARYGEALAGELVPATGISVLAEMQSSKTSAINNTTQSVWLPNASSSTSNNLWSGAGNVSAIYNRGAMIVSMLREMSGDSIFFSVLTKYQTDLKGKTATTDTLKNYFNRELGRDISVFFIDYVGGSGLGTTRTGGLGRPLNTVEWNNPSAGKRLVIAVTGQTLTGTGVAYFRGPIQLRVKGALAVNDTTITIFDWGSGNLSYAGKGISLPVAGNRLTFDLSFVPTSVIYDDNAKTMSIGLTTSLKGTTKNTALNSYTWLGTTNITWGTSTNWLKSPGLPPSGADITIATSGTNQPVLPTGNTIVGPLTISGTSVINLNGNTLILNNEIRGTGTITGSSTSNIVVADQAGTLNFTQTTLATRSLNTLTVNAKASATIGVGLLDIFGGLIIPSDASLTVRSALMLIR